MPDTCEARVVSVAGVVAADAAAAAVAAQPARWQERVVASHPAVVAVAAAGTALGLGLAEQVYLQGQVLLVLEEHQGFGHDRDQYCRCHRRQNC